MDADEVVPRQQRGVAEDGVRNAVGGHLRELAEEDAEGDHHQERLDERPGGAKDGLLVADGDVAPSEQVRQLTVVPELAQIELHPAARGLDAHERAFDRFVRDNVGDVGRRDRGAEFCFYCHGLGVMDWAS